MKNLKKVLALGLALVMILGMFTIASAAETKKVATDLTDWASVENKGAVSLMVDLGVISGMPDGTYSPAKNIDRASWAKMVFFVLTGENDAKVYESDYPALKDIADNWAQGFIEYLYSIECVAGDNEGNYNPGNSITVVEAAKTMLTGLGYNSKVEGYESDKNWATNIMNKAKAIGLLDGISLKQGDVITRDAAAQMVYNALSAKTQTAKYTLNYMTGERVPSGEYTEGVTLGEKAFDVKKFEAKIVSVSKGVATFDAPLASIEGVKAAPSDAGKTATVWCKFNASGVATEAVSTSVASASAAPFKTVADGVDWTKAFDTDNKKDDAYIGEKITGTVSYYKNGTTGTLPTTGTVPSGEVVEFYTNDDGKIDRVFHYEYQVNKVTADASSKTKDDVTTVTLKLDGVNVVLPADQITGDWTSLKEGDVVLYYTSAAKTATSIAGDNTITVEKIEKALTGKVASYKGTTLRVSGKDYDVSAVEKGVTADLDTIKAGENEYDFYLGKDGKICYTSVVGEEVSKDLVLVMDVTEENTGSGFDKGSKISAKVLFVNGTTDIVTLASVKFDGTTETKGSAIIADGKFVEGNTADANILKGFFTYKVNKDGNYELTADDSNKVALTGVNLDGTNAITSTVSGDNATVYIVELIDRTDDDAKPTYTVYTGFKSAPKIETAKVNTAVAYGEANKAAKYVFISASELKGSESKEMFFVPDVSDMYHDNANDCEILVAYNDKGEKVDLKISNAAADIASAGFYKVSSVKDDVYTLNTTVVAIPATSAASAVLGGGVLTIDGKFVAFDDATEMKTITLDADGKVDSYVTGKVDGSFESGTEEGDPTYVAILGDGTVPTETVTDAADVIYVIVRPVPAAG